MHLYNAKQQVAWHCNTSYWQTKQCNKIYLSKRQLGSRFEEINKEKIKEEKKKKKVWFDFSEKIIRDFFLFFSFLVKN